MTNIFISYSSKDSPIAHAFKQSLSNKMEDLKVFLAEDKESIAIGDDWSKEIVNAIKAAEYFIVLLSENSIESEMVIEEIRIANDYKSKSKNRTPYILPIRIKLPFDTELDYNLAAKINRYQQRLWNAEVDTEKITSEIIEVIHSKNKEKDLAEQDETPVKEDGKIPVQKVDVNSVYQGENDEFYIERPVEQKAFEMLGKSGSLIKIKAPSKYGKSHLMRRLIHKAKGEDFEVLSIDFSGWGGSDYQNFNYFFRKFCGELYYRKHSKTNRKVVSDFWKSQGEEYTHKENVADFFIKHISEKDKKLLISISDIDALFEYKDLSNEFCSIIRSWFNKSQNENDENYCNLKFAISYATDTALAIRDNNQSPFNVGGDPIVLNPFGLEDTKSLYGQYCTTFEETELAFIFNAFGGHPYLTKKCLSKIFLEKIPIEDFKNNTVCVNNVFHDHLRSLSTKINAYDLNKAIQQLITKSSISNENYFKLSALGIIKGNRGEEKWSNQLYESFFNQ